MADFQELIKNFDRIRDYMRQFYVYGFKVRSDYDLKSARTYDNERRRIESWLSGYTASDYTSKGKHVYIDVDSKTVSQNPLYAAWKSKSFTDNDMMLHFFLLDLLWDGGTRQNCNELTDRISKEYGVVFESQTVRLKLKEYESLGILRSEKEGKNVVYALEPPLSAEEASDSDCWKRLIHAVTFFQEAAPFGFIGSTILDREEQKNEWFQFKHHFIVHTLEDSVLLKLLLAIREGRRIHFSNKSTRSGRTTELEGVPLKIFVSTQTGRRYLCLYLEERRRFINMRLDSILSVHSLEPYEGYRELRELLEKNKGNCWGVTFGGRSRIEELCVKLYIDEEKEPYILNRLYREGRGGEVLQIREHEYLYTGTFFDTNEMLSWVKSFTGRILDIQGTNRPAVEKILGDLQEMYRMYGLDAEENETDKPHKEIFIQRKENLKQISGETGGRDHGIV